MVTKLEKKVILGIIIGFILLLMLSITLGRDLITLGIIGVIGIAISFYLLNNDKVILGLTLLISLVYSFIIDELNMPQIIKYIPEFLIILILIKIIYTAVFTNKKNKVMLTQLALIAVMLAINIAAYIYNQYPIWVMLWGIKNWYRFFVVFIGFSYLNIEINIDKLIKYTKIFLIIQLIASFYEYFTLGRYYLDNPNDRVSGMFGMKGTGIMLIFYMFLLCFSFARYLNNKADSKEIITLIIIIFIQNIIGELRAGFFYIPMILVFMLFLAILNKISIKKIKKFIYIGISLLLIVFIGFNFYIKVFNNFSSIKELYSFEYLNETLNKTSYNSNGKMINRLNGPSVINRTVLDNKMKKIIGVGIGNASPNQIKSLEGNYFKKYSELKCHWFFLPYFLAENGFGGVIILFLIFMSLMFQNIRNYKKYSNYEDKWIFYGYQGCVIVVLITSIYNSGFSTLQIGVLFWALSGCVNKVVDKLKVENIRDM